jgi:hypothetical protein
LAVAGQVLDECNERDSPNLGASTVNPSLSLNDNGNTSSINENSPSSVSGNSSSVNENSPSFVSGNSSSVRVKDQIKQIESAIQNSVAKGPSISDVAKRREAPRTGAKCAGDRRDTSVITSTMFVQRPKDCRLEGLIATPKLLVEPQAAQNSVSISLTEKPPVTATPTDAPVKGV